MGQSLRGAVWIAAHHPLVEDPSKELMVRWQDEDPDWCIVTFKFPNME